MLRGDGFRVVIYPNDHQPAHVHVYGSGEAKIDLMAEGGAASLVWAEHMTRGELRRAMRLVGEHQEGLLKIWRDMHG